MLHLVLIGIFGAAGAICRYAVGVACVRWLGVYFAFGTLAVNVVGCFLLGLLMHVVHREGSPLPQLAHPALAIGFLGALTTFSTFGYETVRYAEAGEWHLAALNVAGNLVLGLLAAAGGLAVARLATGG